MAQLEGVWRDLLFLVAGGVITALGGVVAVWLESRMRRAERREARREAQDEAAVNAVAAAEMAVPAIHPIRLTVGDPPQPGEPDRIAAEALDHAGQARSLLAKLALSHHSPDVERLAATARAELTTAMNQGIALRERLSRGTMPSAQAHATALELHASAEAAVVALHERLRSDRG